MRGSSRNSTNSSLYQPFIDEDSGEGAGVVLFHRRFWHPCDLLFNRVVTITTHEIRVEAAPSPFMCCGRQFKTSLPLSDVRDLALEPGLWPTIVVYSRRDPHFPAFRLRALRGAAEVFKALREAVSEVQSRELLGNDDL